MRKNTFPFVVGVMATVVFGIAIGRVHPSPTRLLASDDESAYLKKNSSDAMAPMVVESAHNLFRVSRVIDGDTIELAGGARVRYTGINAPESVDPRRPVQCFGVEASKENKLLVEGNDVRLVRDVSDRDRYGRLVRYVYVRDAGGQELFVNRELVRLGYASVDTFPPDVKYADIFRAAEQEARRNTRGLWGSCK